MAAGRSLEVAPELALPPEMATQAAALLAVKGAGKSNAAAVFAEQMFILGIPWLAIDPKGDWWGMRSSADGTGAGLPIPVFGGRHGDLPLTPESGALMAELIVAHNLTCILDVSKFTKGELTRFLTDFGLRKFPAAPEAA